MKKLLAFTAVAMAISMTPALAEHDGEGKRGKMFEKHDTNGDGTVSKSEFLSHAEERFSKIDKDDSGDISKEEAKAARELRKEKFQERRENRKERRDAVSE